MKVRHVEFVTSVGQIQQLLPYELPEIAFVGRSNVGKSSLINALLQRRQMALVSGKPGKTKTINFFLINKCFHLVDLPGYGYASISQSQQASWSKLIDQYLARRPQLALVLHLVDIRHPPSKLDHQMAAYISHHQLPSMVVATKRDKITRANWRSQGEQLKSLLHLPAPPMLFSIKDAACREELWQLIEEKTGLSLDPLSQEIAGADTISIVEPNSVSKKKEG